MRCAECGKRSDPKSYNLECLAGRCTPLCRHGAVSFLDGLCGCKAKSEKSQLIEVVRELAEVAKFYADDRNYSGGMYGSTTSSCEDTAIEALTKHKEILKRLGVNN